MVDSLVEGVGGSEASPLLQPDDGTPEEGGRRPPPPSSGRAVRMLKSPRRLPRRAVATLEADDGDAADDGGSAVIATSW
jgi:hypothetical protein